MSRSRYLAAAVLLGSVCVGLPSLAAAPGTSVTISGAMSSKITAFNHPHVAAKAGKHAYQIVLMGNPSAMMAAGRPMMQSVKLSFPMGLKPGTYKVRGLLEMGHAVDPAKAPVVAQFSCSTMNSAKFPNCLGYNRHAEGTLTLTHVGKTFSGRFHYMAQFAHAAHQVTVTGRFANLPLRR